MHVYSLIVESRDESYRQNFKFIENLQYR